VRATVFILGGLTAFGPLTIDMYLPAFPSLADDLGTGAAQVQLTLTTCLLGLAAGQVLAGPVSDALGRRRPLIAGLVAYVLASVLCALAPSVAMLAVLRFVQGFAGAAGIVIARAIVRDMHSGAAAARFFATLMLVVGVAPILAPVFGGQLLHVTSWRGVFVALAAIGVVLLVWVAAGLGETLQPEERRPGGLRATGVTFRRLLGERAFVGYVLSCGLAYASMFAYIAGSPFVLQDIYDLSPQAFSLVFGINAIGIVTLGQVSGRLVGRVPPRRLLAIGLGMNTVGGLSLAAVVLAGGIGLAGILPALFVTVASIGLVMPNATALALAGHPSSAGSASALLGLSQFACGAAAAPLVGIGGSGTAVPMACLIAAMAAGALAAFLVLTKAGRASAQAAGRTARGPS
jgi:DHA1 family bicyclomycin/chloramphenicol resistance-like MFS transporter